MGVAVVALRVLDQQRGASNGDDCPDVVARQLVLEPFRHPPIEQEPHGPQFFHVLEYPMAKASSTVGELSPPFGALITVDGPWAVT